MTLRPLCAIVQRDLLRMARQRGRLLSAFVRPLIWLLVIGSGVSTLLEPADAEAYPRYLVPGVLGMTMLFGAMLVALTVVYDKELGIMKLLLAAPFAHAWIVIGKTVSATVVAIVQAGALLLLLVVLGYVGDVSAGLLVLGFLGTALACASLGMLVAASCTTLDNFAVMMNFVIFPVFFLSGALYPIARLPQPLKLAATLNPFTYGVDLLKHATLSDATPIVSSDFGPGVDLAVLAGFTVLALSVACLRFAREPSARLLHVRERSATSRGS